MLLTRQRVAALSRISRYAGWTNRGYHVLEHSLIGAKLLEESGYSVLTRRAFMLHDMHETEFGGDITSPIRQRYLPDRYHEDITAWDTMLSVETGVPMIEINGEAVRRIDEIMLAAETRTVFTGNWCAPVPDGCADAVKRGVDLINYQFFTEPDAFWQMWSIE